MLLLRECFRDLSWLALIHSIRGEAGLLVTSIVPKTPFFWAMHITEVWTGGWPPQAPVPSCVASLGWGWRRDWSVVEMQGNYSLILG